MSWHLRHLDSAGQQRRQRVHTLETHHEVAGCDVQALFQNLNLKNRSISAHAAFGSRKQAFLQQDQSPTTLPKTLGLHRGSDVHTSSRVSPSAKAANAAPSAIPQIFLCEIAARSVPSLAHLPVHAIRTTLAHYNPGQSKEP